MSKDTTKLLIMGLDNAGKTSIILSLTKKANLLSFCSVTPTQGLNIVNIDENPHMKFNIWDFGGQQAFREEYIQKLAEGKYLQGVDRMIFVIDAQDPERYDLALRYLEKILKILQDLQQKLDFSIFIHKCDPSLDMEHSFHNRIKYELINKIKKTIPSGFKYKIFKTSVYTVFKKKLVE
ncbi:MAG: 50S ribosome-binding GTPase [Candidatus Helarchaeota archaeon]|nr:50S ribosome-binding GTPase [Candidatus Helarchaeota archaeon]